MGTDRARRVVLGAVPAAPFARAPAPTHSAPAGLRGPLRWCRTSPRAASWVYRYYPPLVPTRYTPPWYPPVYPPGTPTRSAHTTRRRHARNSCFWTVVGEPRGV